MVKLLASDSFYEAYKYVGGLSLFYALYIVKETVDIGPKLKEKTKFLSYTFFISVIVNIGLLYLGVKYLKLEGVVFAMIVTNIALVGISWFVSNKIYYIPFSKIHFISLIIPSLFFSIISLYMELPLKWRIALSIICILYYLIYSIKFLKKIKLYT